MLRTTICGRSSRPAPYAASSASIVRQRSSASSSAESITCTSSRARSRCARNSWPSPTPSLAPSISPGTSATTSCRPSERLHGPEHRREGRERVLGDLRPRVRDPRQERRLAGVREADERGVGEELQAELDLPLVAGPADLGEARRLPGRAGEVLVAAPAAAALRDDDSRARTDEVGHELVALEAPASRRERRAPRRLRARRSSRGRRRLRRDPRAASGSAGSPRGRAAAGRRRARRRRRRRRRRRPGRRAARTSRAGSGSSRHRRDPRRLSVVRGRGTSPERYCQATVCYLLGPGHFRRPGHGRKRPRRAASEQSVTSDGPSRRSRERVPEDSSGEC